MSERKQPPTFPAVPTPGANSTLANSDVAKTARDAHKPPVLPWLEWQVGERVVVRRREADGLYDALGELLEVSPHHVKIRTRKGDVVVPAEKMVTGKQVPPPKFPARL